MLGSVIVLVAFSSPELAVPAPPAETATAAAASPAEGPSDPTVGLPLPGGGVAPAEVVAPPPGGSATAPSTLEPSVPPVTPAVPPKAAPREVPMGLDPDESRGVRPKPLSAPPPARRLGQVEPPSSLLVVGPYLLTVASLALVTTSPTLGVLGLIVGPAVGDFATDSAGRGVGLSLARALGVGLAVGGAATGSFNVAAFGAVGTLVLVVAEPIVSYRDARAAYDAAAGGTTTVVPVIVPAGREADGTPTPGWAGVAMSGAF
jgi:hypothetical protein